MTQTNRIIVALDYDNGDNAWAMVERLGESADYYKVGLQLLTAAGPQFVRRLVDAGKSVFLDLKAFEIPNSVAGAVASAGSLGASMATVHAASGSKALDAAVKAAQPFPELAVLGLTVVTSMTDSDLAEVGVTATVDQQVLRLAKLALNAGCNGLVASTLETRILRQEVPDDTIIVTPGIQLDGREANDQARVASPQSAIEAGATFLVIGRSITQAQDPFAVFSEVSSKLV